MEHERYQLQLSSASKLNYNYDLNYQILQNYIIQN